MLILPLHRPLTRATFPFATALLIVVNAFVFVALQGGDDAALVRARDHYVGVDLDQLEVPAYERHLEQGRRDDELAALHALDADERGAYVAVATLTDIEFVARLQRGELFDAAADHAAWQRLRPGYDALQRDVFTLRHLLRSSEVDPWRMLASAFLHASVTHLLGNMLFLGVLGLLLEGALGSARFVAVYVLGAFGASAASLAWRWGEAGGGLGASGAIAALMGAFCVVWGRQPVRFFYWFGVVFDYVRKPAIWLLPAWLGWELYNLFAHDDLGIGFDAHAGGIVTGALLGAVLVALHQVRGDFIRDDPLEVAPDDRWQRAQAHLGRMQLAEADALFDDLQRDDPARFDVRLARYRVAVNGGHRGRRRERGVELLALPAPAGADVATQAAVLDELATEGVALAPEVGAALARRWLALQQDDAVEALLARGTAPEHAAAEAQLWFELGLHRRARADDAGFRRAMQALVARHPQLPLAQKARFLLDNP